MKSTVSLRIGRDLYERLMAHLFPGDNDEHGAVIAAGVVETPRGIRLLAKELFLAQEGVDWVPGTRGYRALTSLFVAEKAGYCGRRGLAYIAIHCHRGTDRVGLSSVDIASQEIGYPALLQITRGGPVAGIVFAKQAAAGMVWFPNGQRVPLDEVTVIGSSIMTLRPKPCPVSQMNRRYDRHTQIFGDVGQEILSSTKVGIVGLGGVGSLLSEWLVRLGVGTVVAIDFDKIESTNLPRTVGATEVDVKAGTLKTTIARRVALEANPNVNYEEVQGNLVDLAVARRLTDCDFIFLAADEHQARLVFNALVFQYLIPGSQVGIRVVAEDERIRDIHTASRMVIPVTDGGCFLCGDLISPGKLQEESLSRTQRKAQRYVDSEEIAAPAVITLNALGSAVAANDFLFMITGLHRQSGPLDHLYCFPLERTMAPVAHPSTPKCLMCGEQSASSRACGDRASLPCR